VLGRAHHVTRREGGGDEIGEESNAAHEGPQDEEGEGGLYVDLLRAALADAYSLATMYRTLAIQTGGPGIVGVVDEGLGGVPSLLHVSTSMLELLPQEVLDGLEIEGTDPIVPRGTPGRHPGASVSHAGSERPETRAGAAHGQGEDDTPTLGHEKDPEL